MEKKKKRKRGEGEVRNYERTLGCGWKKERKEEEEEEEEEEKEEGEEERRGLRTLESVRLIVSASPLSLFPFTSFIPSFHFIPFQTTTTHFLSFYFYPPFFFFPAAFCLLTLFTV